MSTNENLIYRCLKNDSKAQFELYNRYKHKFMGICIRYANDSDEVEDVFQESFIKIFNNLKNLKKLENFEAWMRRIIVNTAIDHYHKSKSDLNNHTINDEYVYIDDSYEDILSSLSTDALLKIIQLLPDGYRMVFNLYIIDGYSHKEIADMLNITESTSKSQLTRAKRQLQLTLEKHGIGKYEKHG